MTRPSRSWALVMGLLCVTAVVRGGVLWAMRENLQQDPDAYREIAENLIRHGKFALGKGEPEGGRLPFAPTAFRPPLYPVVLSNLPSVDGQSLSLVKVAGLHLVLGLATVWLTWLTARRLLGDGPPGLSHESRGVLPSPTSRSGLLPIGPPGLWWPPCVAGILVACDPILLNQQTLVMTETLAAFLAILSLWCLARLDARRGWFEAGLAGGAIGLAVLCRPTFLPWLVLVIAAYLGFGIWDLGFGNERLRKAERPGTFHFQAINVAALLICAVGVMSPWVIRNYRLFGKPIATSTHGGYTLALGNNEEFYNYLREPDFRTPFVPTNGGQEILLTAITSNQLRALESLDPANEIVADLAWYEAARIAIRRRPLDFARACAYRVFQLWSPLPHKLSADESFARRWMRYATCGWYVGIYLLAVAGIWRLNGRLLRPPWVWGVLLCLAFTAVHTFYWTNLRMRAPFMPFVAIVAAAGAGGLIGAGYMKYSKSGPLESYREADASRSPS